MKKGFVFLILLLPALLFFVIVKNHISNVPVFDDVEAYLELILNFKAETSFLGKIALLFESSGDHIIFFTRFFAVLYYLITSEVNFEHLVLIGNLSLLGLFFVFYKIFNESNLRLIYLLPIALLLFNVQNWYFSGFWAIITYQFPVVLFFLLICLYLIDNEKIVYFYSGLFLAILITFSHGNGFCIWPAGFIILFLKEWKKRSLVWVVCGVLATILFLNTKLSGQKSEINNLYDLRNAFIGFSSYMGTYFDVVPLPTIPNHIRAAIPVAFGVLSIGIVVYACIDLLFLKKVVAFRQGRAVLLLSCMIFIILSAIIIGTYRSADNAYRFLAASPHYRASSGVYIACFYVWMLLVMPVAIRRKVFVISSLVIAIPYLTSLYFLRPTIKNFYVKNRLNAYNQKVNNSGIMGALSSPEGIYTKEIMQRAVQDKIYTYPDFYLFNKITADVADKVSYDTIPLNITESEGAVYFLNETYPNVSGGSDDGIYLILISDNAKRIVQTSQVYRSGKNLVNYVKNTGFEAVLYLSFLEKGTYEIIIADVKGKTINYAKSADLLVVE
jgi:hypothetical protein